MNRGENVLDRRGARQVDIDQHAACEPHLEVVRAEVYPGAMVQGRERRARRQRVEAAGVDHVRAGAADKPRALDARQRVDLGADRQLAVRDGEVGVPRLVQRVPAQPAVDDVGAQAAGDRVVARAADQRIGQVVADDRVGEWRADHVAETREFAEIG